MNYMFLIYGEPAKLAITEPAAIAAAIAAHGAIMDETTALGKLKGCSPLEPTSTALTVRNDRGTVTAVDGPFAETREVLAGYYVLDCADLEEAKGRAARISAAGCGTTVEIRAQRTVPARTVQQHA